MNVLHHFTLADRSRAKKVDELWLECPIVSIDKQLFFMHQMYHIWYIEVY